MKCPETRDAVEGIENLRDPGHELPAEVAAHYKDCVSGCEKYYEDSQALEKMIFGKIKDIRIPEKGSQKLLRQKPRKGLRNALIFLPLAAAACILLIINIGTNADLTGTLLYQTIHNSFVPDKVYAENTAALAEFSSATGLKPDIPDEIKADIVSAGIAKVGQEQVCAVSCRNGEETYTVYIFDGNASHWKCCCEAKCHCLSTPAYTVIRWKNGTIGYLKITPTIKQ